MSIIDGWSQREPLGPLGLGEEIAGGSQQGLPGRGLLEGVRLQSLGMALPPCGVTRQSSCLISAKMWRLRREVSMGGECGV